MSVIQKEIYASIEFLQYEIRFTLGEFHNNRLNILNVETYPSNGIDKNNIINPELLINDIKAMIAVVNKKMFVNVEKVIVVLPSKSLSVNSKRITINVKDKKITHELVYDTIHNVATRELDSDRILVNATIYKYFIDGVSKSKLTLDKGINNLAVDVNLYSSDQATVFNYLNIVEQAGLEIIDICFDSIAMANEMAAFEASQIKNILNIRYELGQINLSLISGGRVVSTFSLEKGFVDIVEVLQADHHLSFEAASNLVLNNSYLNASNLESMPVFLYTSENETKAIEDIYLKDIATKILEKQFSEVYEIIDPILMSKETDVYITGKGAGIIGLSELLSNVLKTPVQVYLPEVIGARDSSYVALLGSLYNYRDTIKLGNESINQSCLSDEIRVKKDSKYERNESEDSMTNKLKELFKFN
ncbi:MAG: hypothetical protein GX074_04650 [Erysipelothrix sp.]|nr:hypothetical protein [Erysipelothrix sp.]